MLEFLNGIIGTAVPIAVMAAGGVFAILLHGLPFTRPLACLRALRGRGRSAVSSAKSLMLALAGTLGVGNIVGVSSAIALGGAGAVFWMWVSALFAMLLKYAEVVLAMLHREVLPDGSHRGGAPYYIHAVLSRRGVPRLANLAASVFAVLCLGNSLSMGCILQSNAAARAMEGAFSLPPAICGLFLALLCLWLSARGRRAVSAVTGALVPLMSALFLVLSLAALLRRAALIPSALHTILSDAFSLPAAGGGIMGFLTSRALRFGTIRGIVSNEAGCGTSPTAHAAAKADSPVEQGVFGMAEVFIDTLLLCTVTALVVILYGNGAHADPMAMTLQAYTAAFGGSPWVARLLALSILCFGFATLLCWAHYGVEAVLFLTRKCHNKSIAKWISRTFLALFSTLCAAGALAAPALVWSLTDLVTGIMTLFNLSTLLLAQKEIRTHTSRFFSFGKF